MEYLAFNFFPNPNESELEKIAAAVYDSDLKLSHLGKIDPPKKWSGTKDEFLKILRDGNDETNYTHSRANDNKVEIDFTIQNSQIWNFSTISISGKNKEYVESICLHFSKYIKSFMCISGQSGLGKTQQWNILLESDACPETIKEKVKNA